MGLLDKIFKKNEMSFTQSASFKGFKKYPVAHHGFDLAQENLLAVQMANLKDAPIDLKLTKCSNGTEALEVYVIKLRIGTIFFGDRNFTELLDAFKKQKISAAHIKIDDPKLENYEPDVSLLVKLEV